MTKVNVYIDSFQISGSQIIAYTLIDGKDIDFNINQGDFETWCDENEMRQWQVVEWNAKYDMPSELKGCESWEEIYEDHEAMIKFLTAYIVHLYDMEAMDIESPLTKICTEELEKSLSTLERLQNEFSNHTI